mmetsp:Transcript_98/g.232  ORF Transcript_98/g.232 Transcript_98/m.232 type:complete len:262 (-) Transcript_98:1373-2158(-)
MKRIIPRALSFQRKMPKLGNLLYRFSGTKDQPGFPIVDYHANRGYEHMIKARPGQPIFNLLRFYLTLLKVNGCKSVDLAAVCVYHNRAISIGIQLIYRLTFEDERTEDRVSGVYGGLADDRKSQITLEEGEYATGLLVHRRGIPADTLVKGITLVTNRRTVRIGGGAGEADELINNPPHTKIIAFGGTLGNPTPFVRKGGIQDIGFYLKPLGWKSRGTHILMRQLVRENRASQFSSSILAIIMQRLISLDDGVFRNVMTFL